MNRRSFMTAFGGASVAASAFQADSGVAATSPPLNCSVENADDRYSYLKQMLKYLCTDLGPRPIGSESFAKGIRYIAEEMQRSLPEAYLDEFRFKRWMLVNEPELILEDGKMVECAPYHGSGGTGSEGVSGTLEHGSDGYPFIIMGKDGVPAAYLVVSGYGPAIPSCALRRKERDKPIIGVGMYDRAMLSKAADDHMLVSLNAQVRYVDETPSWSAVGSIPGRSKKEILFLAHADTVYPSPGANDNTASVITMLMIALALAGRSHEYTFTFVATGGEEYGYQGAKHYAEKRRKEGTIDNIKHIVQFDSLTYGPNFLLTSGDAELRNLVATVNDDLEIPGRPRHVDSDPFVMDASPFKDIGARAIYINSRGYDGITLPVYHRPEDIPATVGFDCVDNGFRVFTEYATRVQKVD